MGYDKGFFISSRDGKHKLVINGFMKPYYQLSFQDVYSTDAYGAIAYDSTGRPIGGDTEITSSGFGVASTRLSISGQVFEVIRVLAEIDYSNLYGQISYPSNADVSDDAASGTVKINTYTLRSLAAYGEFAPMQELKVRAGQLKIPFDKETLSPTSGLTFSSRSLMNRAYVRWGEETTTDSVNYGAAYETQRAASFGYDRGLMVHGKMKDAVFAYAVGVFNGSGANVGNDNRDVAVAVRLSSDLLGEMSPGLSDLEALRTPRVSVGAAFVWDLPEHKHYIDGDTYNSEDANVTGDIQLKWMGLSMFTSVFFRSSDHGAAYHDKINTFGYMGQLAYYVPKIGVEPAFRYSVLDTDLDRDENHVHEFTAAFNYYIYGQNLRIGVEWSGLFAANKQQSFMVPWARGTRTSTRSPSWPRPPSDPPTDATSPPPSAALRGPPGRLRRRLGARRGAREPRRYQLDRHRLGQAPAVGGPVRGGGEGDDRRPAALPPGKGDPRLEGEGDLRSGGRHGHRHHRERAGGRGRLGAPGGGRGLQR